MSQRLVDRIQRRILNWSRLTNQKRGTIVVYARVVMLFSITTVHHCHTKDGVPRDPVPKIRTKISNLDILNL